MFRLLSLAFRFFVWVMFVNYPSGRMGTGPAVSVPKKNRTLLLTFAGNGRSGKKSLFCMCVTQKWQNQLFFCPLVALRRQAVDKMEKGPKTLVDGLFPIHASLPETLKLLPTQWIARLSASCAVEERRLESKEILLRFSLFSHAASDVSRFFNFSAWRNPDKIYFSPPKQR